MSREKGRKMSAAGKTLTEDAKDARQSWKKRPAYTWRRKIVGHPSCQAH